MNYLIFLIFYISTIVLKDCIDMKTNEKIEEYLDDFTWRYSQSRDIVDILASDILNSRFFLLDFIPLVNDLVAYYDYQTIDKKLDLFDSVVVSVFPEVQSETLDEDIIINKSKELMGIKTYYIGKYIDGVLYKVNCEVEDGILSIYLGDNWEENNSQEVVDIFYTLIYMWYKGERSYLVASSDIDDLINNLKDHINLLEEYFKEDKLVLKRKK